MGLDYFGRYRDYEDLKVVIININLSMLIICKDGQNTINTISDNSIIHIIFKIFLTIFKDYNP